MVAGRDQLHPTKCESRGTAHRRSYVLCSCQSCPHPYNRGIKRPPVFQPQALPKRIEIESKRGLVDPHRPELRSAQPRRGRHGLLLRTGLRTSTDPTFTILALGSTPARPLPCSGTGPRARTAARSLASSHHDPVWPRGRRVPTHLSTHAGIPSPTRSPPHHRPSRTATQPHT